VTARIDPDSIDVYDLDQYAESGVPHDQLRRLRTEAPVFRHNDPQLPDGYWAITRHADVVYVSRNPELFSSYEKTAMLDEYPQEQIDQQRLFMLNQDPPEHTRTRQLVNRGFTPRMIARLEERIQSTCDEIVGQAVAKGEGDFVTLCAAELPLIVIAELMGVPVEDRHKVFDWSNRMVGGNDPEYGVTEEQRLGAAQEMWAYANELAKEKRANLQDDIVSKLISEDEAGNKLSELEFDLFFMLLAVAGNETTRNAISGGMHAFTQYPEQWDRLKADPSLIPTAADEIVRWVSPVNLFRRTPRRSSSTTPPPTETSRSSTTPTCSTSAASPTRTSASVAAGRTSAWAAISRSSRSSACSARSSRSASGSSWWPSRAGCGRTSSTASRR
jgi:cholest-4-en-3-one 26-monooxygenase